MLVVLIMKCQHSDFVHEVKKSDAALNFVALKPDDTGEQALVPLTII